MKRRVIKQGHNTLTITLPAKWAEGNSIKAGDELEIEEKGNILQINSSSAGKMEKTMIDINGFDVALEKMIYSTYKKGYDEIEIRYSNPLMLNQIQKIILEIVVGFEIVSHSKSSCVIKSVVEVHDDEFDPILRRTFLLLHSMEEGIHNALCSADLTTLPTFRNMESMNNRYTGFCRRLLNRQVRGDFKNQHLLYCMIEFLEKIPDEYKFLCDYLTENPKEAKLIGKEELKLFEMITKISRRIERLYYKYELHEYLEIYHDRKNIVRECNTLLVKKNSHKAFLHYMLNIIQFYADIATFILTMNL